MTKRKGVSVAEMLVVVFLVGVLAMLAMSAGRRQPQALALAGELAARLRASRQRAMARQERIGVVLPGPTSLSASALEGAVLARLQRTTDWAAQYPKARILATPGTLRSSDQTWLGSWQTLPAVVFDPHGDAHGLTSLTVAGDGAQKVTISPQGTVTVAPTSALDSTPPASPLQPLQAENHAPTIQNVNAAPTVGAPVLPDEANAVVPFGGHVTLTVKARDEDGDRCFVTWECDDGQGFFSTPGEQPMVYQDGEWVASTQFRPSNTVAARTRLELRCRVRDENRMANAGGASASRINVAVGMEGRLAFWATVEGQDETKPGLWSCAPEGHDAVQLLPEVTEYATVSWDGSKIVTGNHLEGVVVQNLDGSEKTEMLPAPYSFASYSPNGRWLAAFHMVEGYNPNAQLPKRLRKAANQAPWYPDRLVVMTREKVIMANVPVPYDPDILEPTVTVPQIIWSAGSNRVYYLYGKRVLLGLADAKLRMVPVLNPDGVEEQDWPAGLALQMHGSPTPREVRSNDDAVLFGFRQGQTPSKVRIREWTGGGKARRPAASSLYDGKSVILSGFREETDELEAGYVVSLWRRGEEGACRLTLPIKLYNDVITWTQ